MLSRCQQRNSDKPGNTHDANRDHDFDIDRNEAASNKVVALRSERRTEN